MRDTPGDIHVHHGTDTQYKPNQTNIKTHHRKGERVLVVSPGRAGSARVAALAAVLREATGGVEPYWWVKWMDCEGVDCC